MLRGQAPSRAHVIYPPLPRVAENPRYQVCRIGVRLDDSPQGAILVTPSARVGLNETEVTALESLRLDEFIDQASIASIWPAADSAGSNHFVRKLREAGAIEPV